MIIKINNRGFTLIELLVATAIFGLVIGGMYTVYSSTQKTTVNQGNLVDVQQNLRVVIDMIGRDLKLAGALVPAGTNGITTGSDATTLNLATVSGFYAYARIAEDEEVTATDTVQQFNISVPTSVDYFVAGDNVRIIRPQNGNQPFDPVNDASTNNELVVVGDRDGPTITISNFPTAAAVQYKAGDIIAKVSSALDAPDPSSVVWVYDGATDELRRNRDNTGINVMANDVSDLTFSYLTDDDGGETTPPLTNADLDLIKAVRVTLITEATMQLDGNPRQRSLSSVIYLRN